MAKQAAQTHARATKNFVSMIAECAYYKSERRGFAPGFELDDWLAAEREMLAGGPARRRRTAASAATPMTKTAKHASTAEKGAKAKAKPAGARVSPSVQADTAAAAD